MKPRHQADSRPYRLAALPLVIGLALSGCAHPKQHVAFATPTATDQPTATAPPSPSAVPTPTPSRKPTPKPTTTLKKTVTAGADIGGKPIPSPTGDGVPTHGNGTFAAAGGGTGVVGGGTTLVKYRVEVEQGISWGSNTVWTADSFAATVDRIIAEPRGWTTSAQSPVTDAAEHMTDASWSFQRVSDSSYGVRILLATPDTTDKLCGQYGMDTEGVYSCRFGHTEVINLRRWLRGAPGFPISLDGYHTMVIDHEMGHFLGFDHMKCPGAGKPAPVMQEQTMDLAGCTINPYPFSGDGTFVMGPWAAS